jgi:hypothetical protein
MPAKPLPSAEVLYATFRYDPANGFLFWRPRPDRSPQWNGRCADRLAGASGDSRYRVFIRGYGHLTASRIIWKMAHGEEPPVVDHIDGDPSNNRLCNLRAATHVQNAQNRRATNKTGFKGVAFRAGRKRGRPWKARIYVGGQQIVLGYFSTPEDASAAYMKAANDYFGNFAKAK